jgi:hypothetical protein
MGVCRAVGGGAAQLLVLSIYVFSWCVARGFVFVFFIFGLLLATCGFLAPPSSVLRLNPSVLIPKEGDHHRSPFQATIPCGLAMLPTTLVVVEECNRLGSVFVGLWVTP